MKGILLCLVLVSYLNVEATADEDVFRGRSMYFFLIHKEKLVKINAD